MISFSDSTRGVALSDVLSAQCTDTGGWTLHYVTRGKDKWARCSVTFAHIESTVSLQWAQEINGSLLRMGE